MKRLILIMICAVFTVNAFAWHKAEVFYNNGTITRSEIKFPDETFTGLFKRALAVKDGDNENYLNIKDINKVVLSNGVTFIKFDNGGKPILLEQVTQYYNGVNILVLPAVYSANVIEASHYMYRVNGNTTFEEQPVSYGTARLDVGAHDGNIIKSAAINPYDFSPVGVYYSSITRNGHLYTPAANDYIYLMKGDQIERLQSVHTYDTLTKFMGDNEKVNIYIKKGLSSFYQLNSLIAVYNNLQSTVQ